MRVSVYFSDLKKAGSALRETGFEMERIRQEAERQVLALTQVWQGEDSAAFKQGYYGAGGLNEFSTRMMEGHLTFYRYVADATVTFNGLLDSIAESEKDAARKSTILDL